MQKVYLHQLQIYAQKPLKTFLLVGWLINPGKTNPDLTPEVYAIASLLQSLVTNKQTGFQVLMTSIIYGLSRSRELLDLCKKFGFGISYQDIKNLLASWAKAEAENGSCPTYIQR